MGLFTEIGRRVEEFKRTAQNAADDAETVRCPACDERFDGPRERCPECGEELAESTAAKE